MCIRDRYKDTQLNRTLTVRVLDEDDNPPYVQTTMQTPSSDIYVKPGEKIEVRIRPFDSFINVLYVSVSGSSC